MVIPRSSPVSAGVDWASARKASRSPTDAVSRPVATRRIRKDQDMGEAAGDIPGKPAAGAAVHGIVATTGRAAAVAALPLLPGWWSRTGPGPETDAR